MTVESDPFESILTKLAWRENPNKTGWQNYTDFSVKDLIFFVLISKNGIYITFYSFGAFQIKNEMLKIPKL